MLQDELKCKQVYARTSKTGYEARLTGKLNQRADQRESRVKAQRAKH